MESANKGFINKGVVLKCSGVVENLMYGEADR